MYCYLVMILSTCCSCGCNSHMLHLSQFSLGINLAVICNGLLICHSIMSETEVMLVGLEHREPKQRMKNKIKGKMMMQMRVID